jgi:hypothetical protein
LGGQTGTKQQCGQNQQARARSFGHPASKGRLFHKKMIEKKIKLYKLNTKAQRSAANAPFKYLICNNLIMIALRTQSDPWG